MKEEKTMPRGALQRKKKWVQCEWLRKKVQKDGKKSGDAAEEGENRWRRKKGASRWVRGGGEGYLSKLKKVGCKNKDVERKKRGKKGGWGRQNSNQGGRISRGRESKDTFRNERIPKKKL